MLSKGLLHNIICILTIKWISLKKFVIAFCIKE